MKTTRTTQNEEATDRFMKKVSEIRETLEALQEAADDHLYFEPDEVNWNHVGTAAAILESLKNALAIARNEAR